MGARWLGPGVPVYIGGTKLMVPPRLTLVSDNTRDTNVPDDGDTHDAPVSGAVGLGISDPEAAVGTLAHRARREKIRKIEALLFASSDPVEAKALAKHLDDPEEIDGLLAELQQEYHDRGVSLVKVAGKWMFRTADDLSYLMQKQQQDTRKLSRAGLETIAIIAYHQPVTRAEIEEIRGVQTSPGTLDVLMETGWIRPRGRRRAPGRPLTYGTTEEFLKHFSLDTIKDLPGIADLKAAGLLEGNLPPGFTVPDPTDVAALMPDELPLSDDGDEDEGEDAQGDLGLQEDVLQPEEPDDNGSSEPGSEDKGA